MTVEGDRLDETRLEIDSADRSMGRMGGNWWDRIVDFVTVIWLIIFVTGFIEPALIPANVSLVLLGVFVADLGVKYRRAPNLRVFLRTRWTDILMVIPYFRIFRILKFVRLLRLVKAAKIGKAGRFPGLKQLEALRRKSTRIVRTIRKA